MSQTTQMESGLPPVKLRCSTCEGWGCVRICSHQGACPCGTKPCLDCDETGFRGCDHCGGPSTHLLYAGPYEPTQPVCDECDPEEPRGGHPMGGMGFEVDYSSALESGRALK